MLPSTKPVLCFVLGSYVQYKLLAGDIYTERYGGFYIEARSRYNFIVSIWVKDRESKEI